METPSPQRSQGAEALLTPQQPDSPQAACLQTEPPLPASAEVARQRTSVWITSLPDQPAGDSCGGVSLGAECSKQQGDSSGSAEAAEGSGASGLVTTPPRTAHKAQHLPKTHTEQVQDEEDNEAGKSIQIPMEAPEPQQQALQQRRSSRRRFSSVGRPSLAHARRSLAGGEIMPAPSQSRHACCQVAFIQRGMGSNVCWGANCKHLLARCSCRIPWPVSTSQERRLPQLQCSTRVASFRLIELPVPPVQAQHHHRGAACGSGWRPTAAAPLHARAPLTALQHQPGALSRLNGPVRHARPPQPGCCGAPAAATCGGCSD